MEYQYSYQLDPSSYDSQGLCNGIPLRVHRNSDLEEAGTIRLQTDWRRYVGHLPVQSYGSTMGPIYNFTSVAIPECRPDRIELVSYIMEFGFLHDDLIDVSKTNDAMSLNDNVLNNLRGDSTESEVLRDTGEARILKKILAEAASIDSKRQRVLVDYWKNDLSTKRDRTKFDGFDDYLDFRVVDCGSLFLIALATFGMALDIPREEKEECWRLTRPVWAAAALTNDVQSWEKECRLVQLQDKTDMVNSIWILMKQHTIDVEEAKARVLNKVKEFVSQYIQTVRTTATRQDLSLDSRIFVEAMQYMISGNAMWGISSPRYHPECSLTPFQLARCRNHVSINGSLDHDGEATASFANDFHDGLTADVTDITDDTAVHGPVPNPNNSIFVSKSSTMSHDLVSRPAQYITSLHSKSIRSILSKALNVWLNICEGDFERIDSIVTLLHNASLMLDDVEDHSDLRRGQPSTHLVFGVEQTINSAGYRIIEASKEARKLAAPQSLDIFNEEVTALHIGQSYDLAWTKYIECPSVDEFLKMIDMKTGALIRLPGRLMLALAQSKLEPEILDLLNMFGRFYQIRDDYMNLGSSDYSNLKGSCEDLDEGKFTLTTIHALRTASPQQRSVLRSLLFQRHVMGGMNSAQKALFLGILQACGSFEYAEAVLRKLSKDIAAQIQILETKSGIANSPLSQLLQSLDMSFEEVAAQSHT
ncbi:Ophiobolin F synthase [Pseudocercospora fuligena]|uniref:Ophiobolin F synthase n=1 Tax=Pseudocercospora fuligena TaxID=685502 RepID=A0A8H6RP40_9PEZI|nr:Ophiobolin F synthase [Pseudocercospora fuligena]